LNRLSIVFVKLFIIFCFFKFSNLTAQNKKWYRPERLGVMFATGRQGGVFLNDKDYKYRSDILSFQFFYPLKQGKFNLDLSIEPSIGFAQHQLKNFYFVQPSDPDYIAKRAEFTKNKNLKEYLLVFNFILSKRLFKNQYIYFLIGFGPMHISKRTERLAKGFAFNEDIGLGLTNQLSNKIRMNIRGYLRHLSNAELKSPNSGINIAAISIGINYKL